MGNGGLPDWLAALRNRYEDGILTGNASESSAGIVRGNRESSGAIGGMVRARGYQHFRLYWDDQRPFQVRLRPAARVYLLLSRSTHQASFTMAFRPLPAQAMTKLLREAKPLQSLFNQAQHLAQLQQLLDSQLQPAARPHCHVASLRQGSLLLVVTDGHWATRLRYQQRRLLRQLQTFEAFAGLERILFKVQPSVERQAPVRTVQLSASAAETLHEAAQGIADPRLRAALERLASRSGKTPGDKE